MASVNRGTTERRRRFVFVLFAVVAIVGFTIYSQKQAGKQNKSIKPATVDQSSEGSKRLAIKTLGELAVKQRASREDYSRSMFGSGWASMDGCDTRNLILQRDLEKDLLDEDGCTVLSGVLLQDPYTNMKISFRRGRSTSSAVQIDHVVALSDAWQKGAQALTPEKRQMFANDPLNLLAVDGPANMEKGDGDAANWLPQKGYRCRYVARQIAVKLKYLLWVTRAEYSAMKRTLGTCPSQLLPVEEAP